MKIDKLKRYIETSKNILSTDAIKEIDHFFNHREYEMAFEGLLIELTKLGKYPLDFDFLEWKALGEHYNLDKETVFDASIWTKFLDYAKDYSNKER